MLPTETQQGNAQNSLNWQCGFQLGYGSRARGATSNMPRWVRASGKRQEPAVGRCRIRTDARTVAALALIATRILDGHCKREYLTRRGVSAADVGRRLTLRGPETGLGYGPP